MDEVAFRVAVLGDSRVFDTYYATDAYAGVSYGYHRTFPHVLQRSFARMAENASRVYDCVHIPDHFRGRTVQNNILRLALIDPDCVVLCDGIWESLVSRKHVAEHFEQRGLPVPEYSDALATRLFLANELSLSPAAYGERIGRMASWFTRRRRKVIWMTMPIPPKGYKDGLHYAGNYRPFDGWHECLAALNLTTARVIQDCGGKVLDMERLMAEFGGAGEALIDQWHFSAAFHTRIAESLMEVIVPMRGVAADCVSRRVMVQGPADGLSVGLIGSSADRRRFRENARGLSVVIEADSPIEARACQCAVWVMLEGPGPQREAAARQLIAASDSPPVVLYPDELVAIDNPAVADRSSFGSLK